MDQRPQPALSLRDRRRAETAGDIARAALALFARKGFDATTADEIAQQAGVSRATFFNYFPQKELILAEFARSRMERVQAVLASHASASLDSLLDLFTAFAAENERLGPQLRPLLPHVMLRPACQEAVQPLLQDAQQSLARGLARSSELKPGLDPRVFAESFFGLYIVTTLQWAIHPDPPKGWHKRAMRQRLGQLVSMARHTPATKKAMMKRAILLLVLLSLAAAWYLLQARRQAEAQTWSGVLESREIQVGSRVGGRVAEVLVQDGQLVEAGAILVRLERREWEAERAQLEARRSQAEAAAARFAAGYRPEEALKPKPVFASWKPPSPRCGMAHAPRSATRPPLNTQPRKPTPAMPRPPTSASPPCSNPATSPPKPTTMPAPAATWPPPAPRPHDSAWNFSVPAPAPRTSAPANSASSRPAPMPRCFARASVRKTSPNPAPASPRSTPCSRQTPSVSTKPKSALPSAPAWRRSLSVLAISSSPAKASPRCSSRTRSGPASTSRNLNSAAFAWVTPSRCKPTPFPASATQPWSSR
ncbi:MAG: TetR family transcriptional regulator [Bryobacterales bacterium]|nr:TetR family transcriptional regulator [Bryobacterales bacterium]